MMKRHKSDPSETEKLLSIILRTWPQFIPRCRISELSSGALNSRSLANKCSSGAGPLFTHIGKRVFFVRESFVKWLRETQMKCND